MSKIVTHNIPKKIRAVHNDAIARAARDVRPYLAHIEINLACNAGCNYCYASSDNFTDTILPKETIFEFIDQASDMGLRMLWWYGGDPILHPDFYEILEYSIKKRMWNALISSGIIPKKDAERLATYKKWLMLSFHLDTIDPETYGLINNNPETLEQRINGYQNLLDAGFPSDQAVGILTISRPIVPSIKKTIDWFVDEMGAQHVLCTIYKHKGFAEHTKNLEPSLSDIKEVLTYRDSKLADYVHTMGLGEIGSLVCRTNLAIHVDGTVSPCLLLRDLGVGNIKEKKLKDIVDNNKDELFFNYDLNGYCSSCNLNKKKICIGCRANAYIYTGDVHNSDPKCFLNREASEYYYAS